MIQSQLAIFRRTDTTIVCIKALNLGVAIIVADFQFAVWSPYDGVPAERVVVAVSGRARRVRVTTLGTKCFQRKWIQSSKRATYKWRRSVSWSLSKLGSRSCFPFLYWMWLSTWQATRLQMKLELRKKVKKLKKQQRWTFKINPWVKLKLISKILRSWQAPRLSINSGGFFNSLLDLHPNRIMFGQWKNALSPINNFRSGFLYNGVTKSSFWRLECS